STTSASLTASWMVPAMFAPAASYSLSRKPEAAPAPDWTVTSAPSPVSRFTVSGVAATRASPAPASRATAMRIRGILSGRRSGKGQQGQGEGDAARGPRSGQKTVGCRAGGNDEHREGGEPMPHHASDRQAEDDVDDVDDQYDRQMKEPDVCPLMFLVVVA